MHAATYSISVSKPTKLLEDPLFFCEDNLGDLVSLILDALQKLDTQCWVQLRVKFLQVEATIRSIFAQIFELPNQRRTFRIDLALFCLKEDSDNLSR